MTFQILSGSQELSFLVLWPENVALVISLCHKLSVTFAHVWNHIAEEKEKEKEKKMDFFLTFLGPQFLCLEMIFTISQKF